MVSMTAGWPAKQRLALTAEGRTAAQPVKVAQTSEGSSSAASSAQNDLTVLGVKDPVGFDPSITAPVALNLGETLTKAGLTNVEATIGLFTIGKTVKEYHETTEDEPVNIVQVSMTDDPACQPDPQNPTSLIDSNKSTGLPFCDVHPDIDHVWMLSNPRSAARDAESVSWVWMF